MVSGTHTIPTIPISLGNSYGSASHIPKKKLLTSQSLLKAILVGTPLLAGLCRKSQPLLAHTRFLTLGVIMLQEWNMEWLDNVNWWSLNSSMHMSTYMYVARSAKQLQHEVKHASLYTQPWRLKEKSRLPNSFTSHHSFWKNKPQSSSCYTKILIHATFSKVNFASNNRRTHHNISLSKQPNHGTISKTEAQWSLLVSSSIPPTSRRRRCGGSYCLPRKENRGKGHMGHITSEK